MSGVRITTSYGTDPLTVFETAKIGAPGEIARGRRRSAFASLRPAVALRATASNLAEDGQVVELPRAFGPGSSNYNLECPPPLKGSRARKILVRPERLLRGLRPLRPRFRSARRSLRSGDQPGSAGLSNSACLMSGVRITTSYGTDPLTVFETAKIGAPGEIRTPDLLVRSQALYPTELRARIKQTSPPALWRRGRDYRPRALSPLRRPHPCRPKPTTGHRPYGGEGGIRTLDGLLTHTPLAGARLRPLGHLSRRATARIKEPRMIPARDHPGKAVGTIWGSRWRGKALFRRAAGQRGLIWAGMNGGRPRRSSLGLSSSTFALQP